MSPVERVYKYELTNPPATLVEDLYTEICTQDEALSDAEWDQLDSLGGNQGRRVHRAREALLKARVRGCLSPEQKKSIVCEFLGLDTRRTIGSPPSTPNPTGEFMRFSFFIAHILLIITPLQRQVRRHTMARALRPPAVPTDPSQTQPLVRLLQRRTLTAHRLHQTPPRTLRMTRARPRPLNGKGRVKIEHPQVRPVARVLNQI
jgi:hypothetical protein